MDDAVIRQIEKEGAEVLLNAGISVPFKELRIPLRRKPIRLRLVMKRPCLAGQLRIAREYLKMGVTAERMEKFTKEEQMRFISDNTAGVSRIIAYTVCRGYMSRHLFVGIVAWAIRNLVEHRYAMAAFETFVRLMGTDPFTNIIRSVERANPMKPRLSHVRKGS